MPVQRVFKGTRDDATLPIFKQGIKEGAQQTKAEALSFLQERYMKDDVVRGDPRAEAILKIARELSEHLTTFEPKMPRA